MGNLSAWDFCPCSNLLSRINWDHYINAFFQTKIRPFQKYHFFRTRHSLSLRTWLAVGKMVPWAKRPRKKGPRKISPQENLFLAFKMLFQKNPDFLKLEYCFHPECSKILRLPQGATQMIPRLHGSTWLLFPAIFDWCIRPERKTSKQHFKCVGTFYFPFHRVSFQYCS